MRRLVLLLLLVSFGFYGRLLGGEISGTCPKLSDTLLVIGYRTEGIVKQFVGLDTAFVNSDGVFSWEFEIETPICCRIPLGTTEACLFVEPGENYVIHLPDFEPKTLEQRLNPFYTPTTEPVFIKTGDTTDINNHWWFYEAVFAHAFQEAILGSLPGRGGVAPWKMRVDTLYQNYPNKLLQINRFCRQEAFLELTQPLMTIPDKMQRMNAIEVGFQCDAYWELFNTRFEIIWPDDGITPNLLLQLAVSTQNLLPLQMDLKNNLGITNLMLAELAICKGLYDASITYPKMTKGILKLLDLASAEFVNAETKHIATILHNKLMTCYVGSEAPYFKLPQANGKLIPTVLDKRYVYIVLGNSKIDQFERDLYLLETYQKMFKRDLLVVPICLYQNEKDVERLQQRLKIKMPITYSEDAQKLIESYDISSYPYYVLVDREGLILESPAPSPDDKFEDFFGKILNNERSSRPENQLFK